MPLLGEKGAANLFLSHSHKNYRAQGLERMVESMLSSLSLQQTASDAQGEVTPLRSNGILATQP